MPSETTPRVESSFSFLGVKCLNQGPRVCVEGGIRGCWMGTAH